MTKHLRLIMLTLLAMICMGGYAQSETKPLFYESFDNCNGIGGNDNKFTGTSNSTVFYDNEGWTGAAVNGAKQCVKLGSKKTKGYLKTPSISAIKNRCILSFKAASWADDNTVINVSITSGKLSYKNGEPTQTITINPSDQEWTDYSMIVSGVSESFTIKFECPSTRKRCFLDEVKLIEVEEAGSKEITLDENGDNMVEAAENVNVTLKRTLYGDGGWNTLCVPFTLTEAQTKAAFGNNVELRELESVAGNTLTFKTVNSVTAGVPCLIKLSEAYAKDTYTFTGVNTVAAKADDFGSDEVNAAIYFIGIYSSKDVTVWAAEGKDYVAYLGANNTFFKAKAGTTMKAFRAFFVVPENTPASAVKAVIDGNATGIEDLVIDGVKANGRVYNLNGQYVGNSLNGLQSGIYIQNGKKIVIK